MTVNISKVIIWRLVIMERSDTLAGNVLRLAAGGEIEFPLPEPLSNL